MPTSQNGYTAPITPVGRDLPGGKVPLRAGPTGDLLAWVGRQFHALVEPLIWPGCWGYAYRDIRGATQLSNHSSGTALDLNAPAHPLGTNPSASFRPDQITAIRAIVARTEGCVRWGGDYTGRRDPMHFEIVASETRCAAVLAKLTAAGGGAVTTGGGFDDVSMNDKLKLWSGEEVTLATLLRDVQGRVADIRSAHYGDPKQKTGDGGDPFGAYVFTDNPGTPQQRSIRVRDFFGELRTQAARIDDIEGKVDQVLALLQGKTAGK
ncbi:M15 family metallopeptidase [Amycolatopsis sp. NPDC051128]|uniref:M15 family metallopeptidase n=1 Tax=Amycolatopsis sp. NPDC051128 TaxID=3155412 RepID=UPI00342F8F49